MDEPPDDRKRGRGKPPRSTRFQPGQSGNPRGRPKIGKDLASVLHNVMAKKILIKENGKQRKIPTREALVLRLLQDALAGKPPAMKLLLELHRQFPRQEEPLSDPATAEWNELYGIYDTDTLEKFRELLVKEQAIRDQKRKRKV